MTGMQFVVALEQVEHAERNLLRVEVCRERKMREMFSIVPRCIGPATMRVDGSLSLPVLKSNMCIRLGHLVRVPLFFEEIDNVRKCVLF